MSVLVTSVLCVLVTSVFRVCFNDQCVYSVLSVSATSVFTVCCLFQQPVCSQCVVCFSNQYVHSVLSVSATSMFTVCCQFQQPVCSQCVVCFSNQRLHSVLSVSVTSMFTVCCLFQQLVCSQCVVCFSNQRVHSVPGWFPGGLGVHHVRRHRQFAIVESLPLFHLSHLLSGLAGEGVYFGCPPHRFCYIWVVVGQNAWKVNTNVFIVMTVETFFANV